MLFTGQFLKPALKLEIEVDRQAELRAFLKKLAPYSLSETIFLVHDLFFSSIELSRHRLDNCFSLFNGIHMKLVLVGQQRTLLLLKSLS
jgi:hypothetical protein